METRRLGRRGPGLSVIGFGAWAIGGGGYAWGGGEQDDAVSIAAIRHALNLGINWIDTAAVYGLGHSEEIVGRAIQGLAERPFIATKCGQVWDSRGRIRTNLRPVSIRREMEASLRRLLVDVIDLYQCPWPDANPPGARAAGGRPAPAPRPPRGGKNRAFGGPRGAMPARRGKTPGQLAIAWVLR